MQQLRTLFIVPWLILSLAGLSPAQDTGGLRILVITGNGAVNDISK